MIKDFNDCLCDDLYYVTMYLPREDRRKRPIYLCAVCECPRHEDACTIQRLLSENDKSHLYGICNINMLEKLKHFNPIHFKYVSSDFEVDLPF